MIEVVGGGHETGTESARGCRGGAVMRCAHYGLLCTKIREIGLCLRGFKQFTLFYAWDSLLVQVRVMRCAHTGSVQGEMKIMLDNYVL